MEYIVFQTERGKPIELVPAQHVHLQFTKKVIQVYLKDSSGSKTLEINAIAGGVFSIHPTFSEAYKRAVNKAESEAQTN